MPKIKVKTEIKEPAKIDVKVEVPVFTGEIIKEKEFKKDDWDYR